MLLLSESSFSSTSHEAIDHAIIRLFAILPILVIRVSISPFSHIFSRLTLHLVLSTRSLDRMDTAEDTPVGPMDTSADMESLHTHTHRTSCRSPELRSPNQREQ